MAKPRVFVVIASVLIAAASTTAQESPKAADPLAPVEVLEGVWRGESEGFGQKSTLTHEWKRVLDGKFMRLTTRSVSKDRNGAESVHEDVGYISWSKDERVLRFRQFLSEGFVNTFQLKQVEKPGRGFNFEPESTEGYKNLAARMTLRFDEAGGYEMILELGTKGEPLKPCQTMKLNKVR